MKKIFLTVLALVLVISLVSCATTVSEESATQESSSSAETSEAVASESAEETEPLKIGATFMDLSNPYFVQFVAGLEDEVAERGYEVTVVDGAGDAVSQVAAVENFIVQGVDVICLGPVDQNSVVDVIQKAEDAGIKVIGCHQPAEGCDGYFIADEYNYGYLAGTCAAEWINQKLGGSAQVALIVDPSMEALVDRSTGCEDAIRELAPDAEIVSIQGGSLDGAEAAANAETILQAYPDVQVIATINDVAGLAVMEVARTHNKFTDDFFICGLDATDEAIAAMKEEGSPYRATVDIAPYESGQQLVDLVEDVMENGKLDPETIYFPMIPVYQEGFEIPGGVSVATY